MSAELPEPLVGPEIDCSDLDGFMLNSERLMSSELLALYGNEIVGAALLLWCRAWKQRPAASLPDDDRVNASFARLSLTKFRQVKEAVMRGFIKCSDGRLYHRFLAAEATKAYEKKLQHQKKRAADAKRLKEWRESNHETPIVANLTNDETQDETRFVADGNGKDRDRDRDRDLNKKDLPAGGPKRAFKGSRLSADWRPTDKDWQEATCSLGSKQADSELAKFRDHWPAQPGKNGVKLDWDATWRNWVRRAAERLPSRNAAVLGPAEPSIDLGGEFREVPVRNLPRIVQMFDEHGTWPFPSPKPGQPGCRVPTKFLPAHLHRREAAA
jgi:uncharacterized protein YdaU (DUF1376 family)